MDTFFTRGVEALAKSWQEMQTYSIKLNSAIDLAANKRKGENCDKEDWTLGTETSTSCILTVVVATLTGTGLRV